MLMKVF